MAGNPPEVCDLITQSLLSGRMTDAEWEDLCKDVHDTADNGLCQWYEGAIEYQSVHGILTAYRGKDTDYKWVAVDKSFIKPVAKTRKVVVLPRISKT